MQFDAVTWGEGGPVGSKNGLIGCNRMGRTTV